MLLSEWYFVELVNEGQHSVIGYRELLVGCLIYNAKVPTKMVEHIWLPFLKEVENFSLFAFKENLVNVYAIIIYLPLHRVWDLEGLNASEDIFIVDIPKTD